MVGCWTCDEYVAFLNFSHPAVECKLLTTCVSVTKQYNLVPVNGWFCLAAGEVWHHTGHASQAFVVLRLWTQSLEEGDEHLPMLSYGAWSTLPYLYSMHITNLLSQCKDHIMV